jgi:hypothetical protein
LDAKGNDHNDITPSEWSWENALWQHHSLFQDAINYYIICLLALVSDPKCSLYSIRKKLEGADSEYDVWMAFKRNGIKRSGMSESIVRTLGISDKKMTLSECMAAVLEGNLCAQNDQGREVLDLALQCLLSKVKGGKGSIQKGSKTYGPQFFDPNNEATRDNAPESLKAKEEKESGTAA